jgi:hypothetical protein
MMEQLGLGVPTEQTELDLPQADDIKVRDQGPVIRASGNGVELASMQFGFPPPRPKASALRHTSCTVTVSKKAVASGGKSPRSQASSTKSRSHRTAASASGPRACSSTCA